MKHMLQVKKLLQSIRPLGIETNAYIIDQGAKNLTKVAQDKE